MIKKILDKVTQKKKKLTKADFFVKENARTENKREYYSVSGKYKLIVTPYHTGENTWRYSQGLVYRSDNDTPIAEIQRNYSHFPYAFIENHKNGHDYLICGEDYQGQTVVELDTGKRVDYVPPQASLGSGFCWTSIKPSPTGEYLAVDGCYWACPYETMVVDFSEPLKAPWRVLYGNYDEPEVFGWIDDETFEIGITREVCSFGEHKGKSDHVLTIEQLEEIEKEGFKLELDEEEQWEEIAEKIQVNVPKRKRVAFPALREHIKHLESLSKTHKRVAKVTKDVDKKVSYLEKRKGVGEQARYHLIAYCLLRGRDYYKMEPKIRQPYWLDLWERCKHISDICTQYALDSDDRDWSPENIKKMIDHATRKEAENE